MGFDGTAGMVRCSHAQACKVWHGGGNLQAVQQTTTKSDNATHHHGVEGDATGQQLVELAFDRAVLA
jgi:hypothetical protein